jgi:restriction system protein
MGNCWLVRAGDDAVELTAFITSDAIGLGLGCDLGQDALLQERDRLVQQMASMHPDWPPGQAATAAGALHRFLHGVSVDDVLVVYDTHARHYLLGAASGPPRYDRSIVKHRPYVRDVHWNRRVARDFLTVRTRHALASFQTVFAAEEDAASELFQAAVPLHAQPDAEPLHPPSRDHDLSVSALHGAMDLQASAFVEDMLVALDPYEMQGLMAGLLRAMGYLSRIDTTDSVVREPGARGAAAGGLGLLLGEGSAASGAPSVFVEVRHEAQHATDEVALAALLDGRNPRDRCLFLSTGGFTPQAHQVAAGSSVDLTLIGLPELRELVLAHYDFLDVETRALVPLRKLYWPVPD